MKIVTQKMRAGQGRADRPERELGGETLGVAKEDKGQARPWAIQHTNRNSPGYRGISRGKEGGHQLTSLAPKGVIPTPRAFASGARYLV